MNKMLIEYFYEKEQSWKDKSFLHQPFGDNWDTLTWSDVGNQARRLASWLRETCAKDKAHVSIVSKNCREWVISDIAIMMAGYVSVPFYPNLNGKQISEVIELGDVDLLLIGKVDGWEDMKTGISSGIPVGRFPHYDGNQQVDIGTEWQQIMKNNEPIEDNFVPQPDDIWSIIFTSGTTGTPKGAYFTHEKLSNVANSPHLAYCLKIFKDKPNRFFSFLPLNHVAERHILMGCITNGADIFFLEKLETFGKNLKDAQPTTFFAVPRIWTKLKQGVLAKMPQAKLDKLLKIPIVNNLIRKKLKAALGLGKARVVLTGAAPMSGHDVEWWVKAGFPLSDAYGQTENFALTSYSPVGKIKPGSVGIAHENTELKISEDNDELLVKTIHLMNGYYKDPEKTNETIKDGWLYTGDAAKVDENGYLYITGRVKDTFKTEKGQFIVPAKIENLFGSDQSIEQMCLLGLGMPHPIMIVVPSEDARALDNTQIESKLQQTLTQVNNALPKYTQVGTVVVAKDTFTVENGLLTPTLKVKRVNMHNKYKEKLYSYCEDQRSIIFE